MIRLLPACATGLLALGTSAALAAREPPPRAVPDRVAAALAIAIGQVTAVEDARDKPGHRVMTVKVAEGLLGAKGLTHVRLLFTPRDLRRSVAGSAPPPTAPVAVGQEGCFFLAALTPDAMHRPIGFDYVLAKNDKAVFDKHLAALKRYVALLEDPAAGLNAKDRDDRFATAALLILRYRAIAGADKTEPIEAEQSKLILQTLAEADWKPEGPRLVAREHTQMTPSALFQLIGPNAQDGWRPPENFREFTVQAPLWLKEHAGSYRIHRFLPPSVKED